MHSRTILSVGNFFITISSNLLSYTLISYLSTFISGAYIGLTIAAGGVAAITSFMFLPRLVAKYGAQQLAIFFTTAQMLMLLATAIAPSTILSAIFVILVISIQPLIYYELDLLLEAATHGEGTTGRVRTLFLTGGNLGSLAAPLLIGILLSAAVGYTYIFLAAAVAITPFIILFAARVLPKGEALSPSHVRDTLTHLAHNRDTAAVTFGHFILYLFYVWAPLYIPVYLHIIVGIPWSTLGWMFSIMLVPYVLIEYPAGWLADKFIGDKELMLAGFLLAGSALTAVSTITVDSPPLYILSVLLATRAGAALIEAMTEGHFFRCVSEKDIVSVSVFRGVWPLANVIAPLIAGLILFFGNYQLLFILAGGFVTLGGALSVFFIRDFDPAKGRICPIE
jgi:MFS family permease